MRIGIVKLDLEKIRTLLQSMDWPEANGNINGVSQSLSQLDILIIYSDGAIGGTIKNSQLEWWALDTFPPKDFDKFAAKLDMVIYDGENFRSVFQAMDSLPENCAYKNAFLLRATLSEDFNWRITSAAR